MPTLFLFLTLLPGILAAERLDPSPAIPLSAALLLLVLFLFPPRRKLRSLRRAALLCLPPVIITCAITVARVAPATDLPAENVVLEGEVTGKGGASITSIRVLHGPLRGSTLPWRRHDRAGLPPAGSIVKVRGDLLSLPWNRNEGGWDRFAPWRRNGAPGLLVGETIARRASLPLTAQWRERVMERIETLGGEEGALFRALFLGYRRDVERERVAAFRSTGLSHLLALSGLHLGILYGVIAAPLGLLPLPKRLVPLLTTSALWMYGAVAGYPVSLVRALIMASFFAAGRLLRWPVRPLNTLGAAALLSLALKPCAAGEVSFQLSFAATAGILACRPILDRLSGSLPARFIAAPLVVSLAAQAATLPLVVYHFQQIAPFAAVATLLVTPFTILSLVTGAFWLAVGPIHPLVDRILESGAWMSLRLFGSLVELAAEHGPAPLVTCRGSALPAAVPLALLLLTLFALRRQSVRPLIASLPLIALLLVLPRLSPDDSLPLRITFIDIGQGSATLIETGSGESILVDAGFRSETWDNGAMVIAPLLKRRNRWPLTYGFVSHPDADHLGGMVSLVQSGGVRRLIDPGYDHTSSLYELYVETARHGNCNWATSLTGSVYRFRDGTSLHMLFAPEGRAEAGHPNDASLVILLRRGRFSLLLPGDAPPHIERFLEIHHLCDRLTVLNAPHHGAGSGCTSHCLARARPRFATISAGEGNGYGHPHPGVLRRLARSGSRIYRTDLHGAITMRTDGRRLRIDAAAPGFAPENYDLLSQPRVSPGFW